MDYGYHIKSYTCHPTMPGTFLPQHGGNKISSASMTKSVKHPLPTGTHRAHRISSSLSPSRAHRYKYKKQILDGCSWKPSAGEKSSAPIYQLVKGKVGNPVSDCL